MRGLALGVFGLGYSCSPSGVERVGEAAWWRVGVVSSRCVQHAACAVADHPRGRVAVSTPNERRRGPAHPFSSAQTHDERERGGCVPCFFLFLFSFSFSLHFVSPPMYLPRSRFSTVALCILRLREFCFGSFSCSRGPTCVPESRRRLTRFLPSRSRSRGWTWLCARR